MKRGVPFPPFLVCLFLALCGCGYVGEPLPPALNIPVPVVDLRAAEYGDRIIVEFTLPSQTTEGLTLKTVQAVELLAGPGSNPFAQDAWERAGKKIDVPARQLGPVSYEMPAADWIGKELVLAVRTAGPKGKMSAWSNFAIVGVEAPLATPVGLKANATETGVLVSWSGSAPGYRVFRSTAGGKPEPLADAASAELTDSSTQYGATYEYQVQAVSGSNRMSALSAPVAITPADTFPPAAPGGLSAVPGLTGIELAWERNTEADFKGYNVYRATEDGPFERVASGVEAPTLSDAKVESGKRYRYAVTSVDLTGNESARSAPTEVVAP